MINYSSKGRCFRTADKIIQQDSELKPALVAIQNSNTKKHFLEAEDISPLTFRDNSTMLVSKGFLEPFLLVKLKTWNSTSQ